MGSDNNTLLFKLWKTKATKFRGLRKWNSLIPTLMMLDFLKKMTSLHIPQNSLKNQIDQRNLSKKAKNS